MYVVIKRISKVTRLQERQPNSCFTWTSVQMLMAASDQTQHVSLLLHEELMSFTKKSMKIWRKSLTREDKPLTPTLRQS